MCVLLRVITAVTHGESAFMLGMRASGRGCDRTDALDELHLYIFSESGGVFIFSVCELVTVQMNCFKCREKHTLL